MPNCSNASSRIASVRPVVRRSSGYPICRVFEYLLQRPPSIGGAVKKSVVIIISYFGAYFFYYFSKFLNNAQFCTDFISHQQAWPEEPCCHNDVTILVEIWVRVELYAPGFYPR